MTSALRLLPAHVLQDIKTQAPYLRDDLRIIPEAEAAGWKVTFRDDNWHNSAHFRKSLAAVWYCSLGWRVKTASMKAPITVDNLRNALGL